MEFEGILVVIYILIISIIAITWIMLPFAVFGIKTKLDVMIEIIGRENSKNIDKFGRYVTTLILRL